MPFQETAKTMFEKLNKLETRYIELEHMLADHSLMADTEKYNKMANLKKNLKFAHRGLKTFLLRTMGRSHHTRKLIE